MKKAFTLAEVLITIAIIGIVAALTIPSVIASFKDKQYNTARLKALKTFGDAGRMASIHEEMNGQANATDFVNNVLSKYLKITKVCESAEECGFPSEIQPSNPAAAKIKEKNLRKWGDIGYNYYNGSISPATWLQTMSKFIATNDGFSALVFYNSKCGRTTREITDSTNCKTRDCSYYAMDAACMNVVYDMNGTKGPNHVGEDIGFVTTFWSGLKAISVAPGILPYDKAKAIYDGGAKNLVDAQQTCANAGSSKVPYTLGSREEIQSVLVNSNLASLPDSYFWSASTVADEKRCRLEDACWRLYCC